MKHLKRTLVLLAAASLLACGQDETWLCKVDGKAMYSINTSGHIGSADKGCSCEQIRSFELETFGEIDEQALKNDFGC